MPLFRRKTDPSLPKTSSLSVYGQGRAQVLLSAKNADTSSDSGSLSSQIMDDRPQPFLAFAEATYDPGVSIKTKSRLSKDLCEVLNDNAALAYFIQFMEANKVKFIVKFWLEAESFRVSAETKCKTQTQKAPRLSDSNLYATLPSSGSSGCVSDKSDELFQGSSHNVNMNSKNTNLDSEATCDIKSKTNACNNELNDNDKSVVQRTISHLDTVSEELRDMSLKDMKQNSSTDSVLGSAEDIADYPPHSPSGGEDKTVTVNSLNVVAAVVNSVQNSTGYSSKVPFKEWTCDAINYFSVKEPNSDQLKDGCVRLETSIEQDANYIYSKYIAQDASFPIGISVELRKEISDNISKVSGPIDPNSFVIAQDFALKRMEKEYFPSFLRSSFNCKYQIDVLTSGTVFLADVLYNDSALFFFMEFVEQEGVRHLVDFLLMADNFQKQHLSHQETYDGMQAQADAMVLYEKYFSLQATSPLGFSDSVRYEVETNICREEGALPDCFMKPFKILTQYLEKTYLLQFLNSQLYFKYISECIIIIQNEGTDSAQSRYTGSDSGSEQSLPISSVNTLLAMDSKQPGATKVIKNIDDQDMRIDMMQFKPDALWQRPLAGKLQMAHVDHLGRVISEFEPEPDRRKESRISKAMKKLVNWEEDKDQEDMAWKVAEMIVKDICSVTMPETNNTQRGEPPS